MPQINCLTLVAEFLSLPPGPVLPLLVGEGFLFLPVLILFSFPQVCFVTFVFCLLGQKDRRPVGYRP